MLHEVCVLHELYTWTWPGSRAVKFGFTQQRACLYAAISATADQCLDTKIVEHVQGLKCDLA